MEKAQPAPYLYREEKGLLLCEPFPLNDVVKQLSVRTVFLDYVKMSRSIDYFVQSNHVRVFKQLENLDLACDSLDVRSLRDF